MDLQHIIDAQEWENWETVEDDGNFATEKGHMDIAEVLSSKLDWVADGLKDLERENGDDHNELAGHLETIEQVRYVLSLVSEKSLTGLEILKVSKECTGVHNSTGDIINCKSCSKMLDLI